MSIEKPDFFAPPCTVAIPTRNRPLELDRCLEGVGRLSYPQFDVIVVDNGPSDSRGKEVAKRRGAQYILEPVANASRARNRGAAASHAEIVAYLDDDCIPEPGWLSALAIEFKDPQVMAVSGRILPLVVETEVERLVEAMGGFEVSNPERRIVDRQTPQWFEMACFGGLVNGANMAFRRVAFNLWPGFNERIGPGTPVTGGEEHLAFFDLVDRGYRAVYTPDAVVRHPFPKDIDALRARELKNLAAATAYMTFLTVEEPQYRRLMMKYAAEGLRGVRRPWRKSTASPQVSVAPRWRRLAAYLSGPFRYVHSRFARPRSADRS